MKNLVHYVLSGGMAAIAADTSFDPTGNAPDLLRSETLRHIRLTDSACGRETTPPSAPPAPPPPPPPIRTTLPNSSNCIATLAEWSNLRCQTLFFTKDTPGDTRRADAIVDPDPSAWEKIVADTPTGDWPTTIAATPAATSTQEPPPIKFFGKEEAMLAGAAEEEEKRTRTEPFTEGALSSPLLFPRGSLPAHVETMRSKLRTLGDGVLLSPAAIFEDMGVLGSNFEENNREGRMSSNRRRWGGMDRLPPWSVFSPKGCPLAEVGDIVLSTYVEGLYHILWGCFVF